VLEVRPPERPAVVIRTSWQPTASTTTDVIVSMPPAPQLDQPRPLSLLAARGSPSYPMHEVVPSQPDPAALAWLASSSAVMFAAWEERAAIHQFDGGLPRRQAEILALVHLYAQAQRAGPEAQATPPPQLSG